MPRSAVPRRVPTTLTKPLLALGVLLACGLSIAQGANLTFDATTGTAGAQDGTGAWSTGGGNFRNTDTSTDNVTFAAGDAVTFGAASGAAGTVTITNTVTTASITFAAPGSSAYIITGGTVSMTNGTITQNANASINSILAGSNVTKNGTGTLTLSGNSGNTFTGALNINAGTVILNKLPNPDSQLPQAIATNVTVNIGNGSAAAILQLGRSHQIHDFGTVLNFSGTGATAGIFRMNGSSDTVGTIKSTGGAGIIENNHATTASTLTVNNSTNDTFTGIIRNGGTAALNFAKANTGTLTLTGTNTYTGTTTVRTGILELTGTSALTSTTNVVLATGGTLRLKTTSNAGGNDAINNAATVTLRGGTLSLDDDGTTTPGTGTYKESFGAATAQAGASTISSDGFTTDTTQITLASLSRNKAATVNFTGLNLGQSTANRIIITSAPSSDHGLMGGWATVGNEFAKYDSTNGVTALTAADYVTSGEADWTFEANAKITGDTALTATRRVNSLNIAAAGATNLNLGGNTLRVESGGLLVSGSSAVTISNGTLTGGTGAGSTGELIIHQNSTVQMDITATAIIADNGSRATALVKSGTGGLRLSGANTFTGGVFINGGVLQLNNANAINAANTLAVEGGALDLNGFDLTVASLSSLDTNTSGSITNANAAGGTKTLTVGGDNSSTSYSGIFNANFNFVKTGTGTFTLNQGNTGYSGVITVAQGTLATGSASALGNTGAAAKTVVLAGATLDISNGINRSEVLEVAGHGVNGLGAIVANSGDSQNIQNMTLTDHTTLGVNVRYDFDGTLAGGGFNLTKIGGGELALEGANVATLGDIHVKQATVTWSSNADLGVSTNTLYVDQGATAQFFSKANDIKKITLAGGTLRRAGSSGVTTLDVDGGLRLKAGASSITSGGSSLVFQLNTIQRDVGATLNIDSAAGLATTDSSNDVGGILGGYATVGGSDWATRSGTNPDAAIVAYTTYAVNDFTTATNNVNLTVSQSAADATVHSLRFAAAGTTLTLTGTNTIVSGGILITSGGVANISGGTLRGAAGEDLVIIQNNTSTGSTISSKIEDNTSATALTKAGGGTLILSGDNAYTGGTFLVGGTLAVTLISDSGTSHLGKSTSATDNILTFNGGTLSMQNTSADQTTARNVSLLSGGGTVEVTNAARTMEFSGVISGEALLTGEGTYAMNSSFTKTGNGQVTFSGASANTYTGLTTITAGTLNLAKSIGVTAIAGDIRMNGGTLFLTNLHQIADTSVVTYTNSSSVIIMNGSVETIGGLSSTVGGAVRNNRTGSTGSLTTNVAAGAVYTFSGILENGTAGNLSYTKSGAGTQIFTGTNTYSGPTNVNGGVLQLGNGGTTGSIASGSAVAFSGGNLVINRSDNVTFSNAMSGTGTFTVAGTGAVTVSSTSNTYAGSTEVRSGTLYVTNASGSATGTSAVNVYGTGKLGGTGSIAGAVTARDGGQITPGNTAAGGTVGTLTLGSDLTVNRQAANSVPSIVFQLGGSGAIVFNDAAGIAANMGNLSAYYATKLSEYESETGEHDRLLIGGALNLDAGATIALDNALGYTLKAGDVLDLMDWVTLNLANAPGDRLWSSSQDLILPTLGGGLSYDLSLFESNGIVVVVGAVPEPGRAMLLMFGLAGLVLHRRRRE